MQREDLIRKSYHDRVRQEEQARIAKAKDVERMERLELELIERLKVTQQRQRDAYQKLETVVKRPETVVPSSSEVAQQQQE